MKRRRHFVGCLFIVGACFLVMGAWLLFGRIHWWLGGRISDNQMSQGQMLDFSGEYVAEIRRTRLNTASMAHPFLPDYLVFSNANVSITQHGKTNMTVICQSANGKAETNNIVVSGWRWRWRGNRLEYAQTAIGPGLGFGVLPGISTFKSRCCVEAVRTNGHAHQTLRITLTNQVGGVMLPFGLWSDPEDSSEIILTPVAVP